jgi:hypothetical protein
MELMMMDSIQAYRAIKLLSYTAPNSSLLAMIDTVALLASYRLVHIATNRTALGEVFTNGSILAERTARFFCGTTNCALT